jgi:hypothetical protein
MRDARLLTGDTILKLHLVTASLLASLTLMPIAASAYDRPGEHNSGQHVRRQIRESEHERHLREERERHIRLEREARLRRERETRVRREHHEARHEFRAHDRGPDPHGWDKGQKRGWKGGALPPGQEKKAERGR